MSDFKQLSDKVMVSPQIDTADIDAAVAAGVTLIVNNRPDGEADDQPTNETLASYAVSKGIKWAFIPVNPGQMTMEGIEGMSFALRDSDKILAYCRTGTRSCNMWGLAEAFVGGTNTAEILEKASAAGYDLSGLTPTLEHLHANAGN
jgi:uncharacterized protein (TIGR01244 family)